MKRPRSATLLATTAAVLLNVMPAQAGVNELDPAFGGGGWAVTDFTPEGDIALGVAIQSDGRIVVAGVSDYYTDDSRFALARYDVDGSLDGTFGTNGKVTTNFTPGLDVGDAVAIQSDGRIVVAGLAAGQGGRFAVARYETDGTLDTTFSGDGKVMTNVSSGDDFLYSMAIQADGKIVAVGGAGGQGGRIALARYQTNGTPDPSFGGDGIVTTNVTGRDDRADDVVIQPSDGKIVLAGTADYFTNRARFVVRRYTTDGHADTSFGGDGMVTTNFTPTFDGAFAVALQADGKVVAGGQAGGGDTARMGLARYGTDGAPDASFGGDGTVTVEFTTRLDYVEDLAIQPADGKIVAIGSTAYYGPDATFAVARLGPNGTLDDSFGGDGRVTTNFSSRLDRAYGVALQEDGKIVLVGRADGRGGRFALARYLPA